MGLAQARGHLDALVGSGGRHPDVGKDHIRTLALDRVEERVEV
jgi:hypothetical protein